MAEEELLVGLAQIAITLVGFASLAIAYRRDDRALRKDESAGQKVIIELGLLALFLFLVPTLLYKTFNSETHIWRASSLVFLLAFGTWNQATTRRIQRDNLTNQTGNSIFDLGLLVVVIGLLILQVINLIFLDESWPFLWAMVFLLAAPSFQFLLLVYKYLDTDTTQESPPNTTDFDQ